MFAFDTFIVSTNDLFVVNVISHEKNHFSFLAVFQDQLNTRLVQCYYISVSVFVIIESRCLFTVYRVICIDSFHMYTYVMPTEKIALPDAHFHY